MVLKMNKNRLTVTINGRMYTLVSEESGEYMEELAAKGKAA